MIRKAITYGVKFSTEEIRDLLDVADDRLYPQLLNSNSVPYTQDDFDYFYDYVDDGLLKKLAEKNGVVCDALFEEEYSEEKRPGFFAKLFGIIGAASEYRRGGHTGICGGNCADCPPHYGYRYGKWYYGHEHARGCEFGNNKGGGNG